MQVVAAWGVEGLGAAVAGELFDVVRGKLGVAQPPPELTTSYHEEYFAANAAMGVDVIEPPAPPTVRPADPVSTLLAYSALALQCCMRCAPLQWVKLRSSNCGKSGKRICYCVDCIHPLPQEQANCLGYKGPASVTYETTLKHTTWASFHTQMS